MMRKRYCKNTPTVNSDIYQKVPNDREEYQKLLDRLIELNTIRWTTGHIYNGIYVNMRYTWNTKHPYIQKLIKKKLVKLIRERTFLKSNHSRTLMKYHKEIIMAKYITEVLSELNKNPKLFATEYKKVGNGGPLGIVFKHAFTKSNKFVLPEGTPPFKPSAEPMGMTPSQFITETRKFQYFCNRNLSGSKREMLFVQMCESIHPDEVKILMAIKDQKLHEMYPNITPEVVAKAGFIGSNDMIEVVEQKKGVSKPKNGQTPGVSEDLQGEANQSE